MEATAPRWLRKVSWVLFGVIVATAGGLMAADTTYTFGKIDHTDRGPDLVLLTLDNDDATFCAVQADGTCPVPVSVVAGGATSSVDLVAIAGDAVDGNPISTRSSPTSAYVMQVGGSDANDDDAAILELVTDGGALAATYYVPVAGLGGGSTAGNDPQALFVDDTGKIVASSIDANDVATPAYIPLFSIQDATRASGFHGGQLIAGTAEDGSDTGYVLPIGKVTTTGSGNARMVITGGEDGNRSYRVSLTDEDGRAVVDGVGEYATAFGCGEVLTVTAGARTFDVNANCGNDPSGNFSHVKVVNLSRTTAVKVLITESAGAVGEVLGPVLNMVELTNVWDSKKVFEPGTLSNIYISNASEDCNTGTLGFDCEHQGLAANVYVIYYDD